LKDEFGVEFGNQPREAGMIGQLRQKSLATIAALSLSAVTLAPATAAAQAPRSVTVPVVGNVAGGGTFSGALTVTRFSNQNGVVTAFGTVSGILTNAAGTATSVLSTFSAPVTVGQGASAANGAQAAAISAAACSILHLDLGPLSLNLLGLTVDLSEVVLDIAAEPGAGNLLGNLLCSVAGLLDSPGGLARLLNQILGILG
jgi:hypothetical protein